MWLLLARLVLLAILNMTKISKKSKRKRVEYQKHVLSDVEGSVRTKPEQERYRGLFGLTENIELVGEEDLVLLKN